MIEIFKTNIQEQEQAMKVHHALRSILPDSRINFDLDDRDKILRVEHTNINPIIIITTVQKLGFLCKLVPDKICRDMNED